jgi:GNAT superfamily N-acetyltransferase
VGGLAEDRALADAVSLSYRESFAALAGHSLGGEVRRTTGATAFLTGAPLAFFNGCVIGGPTSAAELEDILTWLDGHAVPYQVSIAESLDAGLARLVEAHGLERDPWQLPGMAMRPPAQVPPPPPGLAIVPVTGADFDLWTSTITGTGIPADVVTALFPASLTADPDVRLFAGLLAGRPVATSVAARSGHACGIYGVSTVPDARRRGIGTAMTWAAAGCARDWGSSAVVLQASEMGRSAYARMGFATVVRYAVFLRDAAVSPAA